MTFFSGIRFDVGFDFISYYKVIIGEDELNYNRFGIFDRGIIELANWLNFPQLYFLITSFIIYVLIIKTIKTYSVNRTISLMAFLALPFLYFHSLTIIRQFIAISIIFYSFQDVSDRKLIPFLLKVAIASLFHFTALICIPIYFLFKLRVSPLLFLFSTLILWYLSGKIIDALMMSQYRFYITLSPESGLSLLIFLLLLLTLGVILRLNIVANGLLNIFGFGVLLYAISYSLGEAATRISYYYLIFIVLLLPYYLTRFKKKYSSFLIHTILLLLFQFNFYLFEKNEEKNAFVPYRVFFLENPDYYKWK